jgi:hypothetical protein
MVHTGMVVSAKRTRSIRLPDKNLRRRVSWLSPSRMMPPPATPAKRQRPSGAAPDRRRGRDDLRRGYLLHGGSSCPRGLGWRLSRSQRERTRREDRLPNFHENQDNLRAVLLALKQRRFERAVRPASGERSGADPGATRDVRTPHRLRQARRWRTRSVRDGSHPSVPRLRSALISSV